jgi:hypothetical protein
MNEHIVRRALITLLLFDAATAIPGAVYVVPTLPREWIAWGPFTDYTVPAIALGLVGVLSLAAAFGVIATPRLGAVAAIPAGLAMSAFEVVEVAVVGIAVFEHPEMLQSWLQPIFFAVGLFVAALGLELYRRGDESRVALRPGAAAS